ncbi:unnamed protein product [Malus baccata var. baccata]
MEIKENLESFGSLANPNSEKRKIEISDYDASSSDNRPSKRARRNISSGDGDKEEEVKSTRSSSSTSSDKTEKINETINLDLNMPASADEEDDDRMFLESTWSNNVKQRDCGDGEVEEVEEIKLDLNSTPAPSEGAEGYNLEGEVWPEDWDQQVGGCDDDHDDFDGNDQDYYDDGGYDDNDDDDVGNKRIKLDLNSTPLSEEVEEQEVRQEEKEEDQRQYQLDEEDRPVEVRYQSEAEEKEKEEEVRPEEGQDRYQEDDEEDDQYCYQSKVEDQRCYQAEEKEVRSEESWHPSEEEEEVVRLPNTARSNLDFSRTPTEGELEDLKNSTIPPAKKWDDEPEHSSDNNHSSFVCEICVQHKVSSEWFALENCGHAYCKDCMIKHVATKLRQNIVSIPIVVPFSLLTCLTVGQVLCENLTEAHDRFDIKNCSHAYCTDCMVKYVVSKLQDNITSIRCPVPNCIGLLEPEYCRPILPPEVFYRRGSALCEAVILGSEKFYCSYKDCSAMLIDDGTEVVRQSVCPNCWRMFCAQCKVPWHEGIKCEGFLKLNKDEREKEDIITKDDETALDKQNQCRTAFCYRCGDVLMDNHNHYCPSCEVG